MRGAWHRLSGLARAAYIAATVLTATVVAAGLGAYGVYRHLAGNVSHVNVSGLSHRSVYGAQNILLLGSQTRDGQGRGFGSNPSLDTRNSDNLLLVHLDATHTHAIVLSIPRDTMFDFNSFRAMVSAIGGVRCACRPAATATPTPA
jgi:anionic cell wall polymer biosynthesis LytR-Cps2A-Psr (LCP) family protein